MNWGKIYQGADEWALKTPFTEDSAFATCFRVLLLNPHQYEVT
jgi:hypothetical protein